MFSKSFFFIRLLVVSVVILGAAGCEDTVEFANGQPGGISVDKSICYLGTGGLITFRAKCQDPDGDLLSFRWTSAAGEFTTATNDSIVTWRAPAVAGVYSVKVSVSDGLASRSKTLGVEVGENINSVQGEVILENNGYPYLIASQGQLTIPAGSTLRIRAGVDVVINSVTGGLLVRGNLVAEGELTGKIMVIPNSCKVGEGRWEGIRFEGPGATGSLKYVDFLRANRTIWVKDDAVVSLDTCVVQDSEELGVWVEGSAHVNITGCKIWYNDGGVRVTDSYVTIDKASIRYNQGYGIYCAAQLADSPFEVYILNSVIANNDSRGIILAEYADPVINMNTFFYNEDDSGDGYALELTSYFNPDSIDARMNFWRVTESEDIAEMIYDKVDDEVNIAAYVDYSDWLMSQPAAIWRKK
ncbi:MAG: right-handed parallel beta-helix repeat-containing protein [Candidatus Krumholzibacteriota bacterium]|nr:right-handed parallel beta-helix repeat-containing protein [Candidatus Krumholzibacteriota bacterium]